MHRKAKMGPWKADGAGGGGVAVCQMETGVLGRDRNTGAPELGGSAPGLLQDLEHGQQQGPVSGGTKPVPGPGEPAACRDCDGTWV